MSSKIQTPYPLFSDIDGHPLDAGFIYVGEAGKNPEVYPIPVFWDEALTIPAEQPIRTRNGYLSYFGRAGKIYVDGEQCSVTVRNKRSSVIYTDLYADLSFTQTNANEKFKNVATNVESMADLIALKPSQTGQTIFLKSYFPNKNKGGGFFIYDEFSSKSSDGGMIVASSFGGNWERVSLETYHNVQWWGALGESTDDTDAIWRALQAHGSYTFNNLSNPTNASFCSIYFPQSSGTYVITRPIKLLPYMRIIGDSTKGGSLWGNSANWKSVIETRFPLAENYEWAITTMNYVRATGQPTTWDSNYSGNNYDSGIVTGCFGSSVQDIVLVNLDTNKRVYGGIRMQNAPQCSVIDCYVQGFDFCVYSSGSWDSRFDVGTVSYKCGFGCYGDMNNARINGYHHGTKDGISPMSQQHPTAYINDSTSGLENYSAWANYKYGVIVKYAYGFTSQNLIAEYHDVGILFVQCTGTTGAIYTEKNTRGIATVATNVNIGSISGVQNTNSFAFGTGSKVEVGHMVPDNFATSIRDLSNSQYNSEIILPTSVNTNGYNVFPKNGKNIVYVSATGSDSNNGLTSSTPVATIGKAIDIFLKQRGYDTSVRDFIAGRKRIIILDSTTYTVSTTQALSGDWEIECINATKATLSWGVAYWALTNAQIRFKNINLTRAVGNNGLGAYMTGAIISSTGNNTLTIDNADVNINGTYALVSMHNSAKGNLNLDISGGTFTTTDNTAKIVEHLNTATNYLIKYGIVTTLGANLSGRADKGVDVPSGNVVAGIVR
ncbi:glycosyl hydrolase family 28-related protein [Acinetobacter pittii]|uniref:glycosyl hydrolase family 28-related protein n=1 Tax=Acinetobacter pittii TaxID=48296 RepID=UPI002E1869D4|nr:glycosyl hydrolase family 28-related protein [Acinetobacter pittii]